MGALDTLFFDLKINDLTDAQIESIKSKLENIGVKVKIIVDQEQLNNISKQGGAKIRIDADTQPAEIAIKKITELINKGDLSRKEVMEMNALTRALKVASDEKIKSARADEIAQSSSDKHAIALERLSAASSRAEKAQLSLANAHKNAEQGVNSHINANMRLGQSMTGLISISGDLRNQLGMLVSAYTVEHLFKNVIETGGEFEKQKLAMGAMLGGLEKADDIFNKDKNLALTSPFNFKDLSNYSKQLSAYGTDYKDLYDTTNRLADISAGLGGDMSRLVLAFSQVKAASFLRGQEMRQFTEFGVSLPEMLAEKYTKAEGKIVTAGDVIERVSKRMVSFNDVKDVLWQSTNQGGKFYGMQDVLSKSVSGMASNLKDAIDTAYYDISNSNNTVIKEAIKGLTDLVSHWRELSSVLIAGVGAYSVVRLATSINNNILGLHNAETIKSIMIEKQEEASILQRKALYGQLSISEKERLANVKTLTSADIQQLAASKSINSDSLMRMVNSRKITASQALEIASTLGLSVGQKAYLYNLQRIEIELAKATGFWDRYTLSLERASIITANKIGVIGSSIKSFLGNIFTKANVGMAAAFFGVDAYMDYQQRVSQIDEINKQTIKNAEDGANNLSSFLKNNPIDLTIKKGNIDEIGKLIESYKEQIISTPIDMSAFILNVDSITDSTKKLQALRSEMESMRAAADIVSKNGNAFSQSQKNTESYIPDWVRTMGQTAGGFLEKIGIISESIRNWANIGDDAGKSLSGVISDVTERTYALETEMYKLNSNDIDAGIKRMKSEYPELAKQIERMRDAGASNNDVIKSMLNIEYDKKTNFLPQIDATTVNQYRSSYNSLINDFTQIAEDGVSRANSYLDRVDVEGHTEKWRLAIIRMRDEEAKSLNLSGDALEAWNFIIESVISKNSLKLQDHPKAWQSMFDSVNSILLKEGKNITNASKEQAQNAINAAINQLSLTKPWLSNWITMMNAYTKQHPIYVYTTLKNIGKDPNSILSGNGRKLSYVPALKKYFTNEDFASMTDDTKQNEAFQTKDKELRQKYIDAYKAKNSEGDKFYNDWLKFRKETSPFEDWNWDETHKKNGDLKKVGKKPDQFLKDLQTQYDTIKKAIEVYKQGISSGESQLSSIKDVDNLGILPKGTFNNITNESQLNKWYKERLNRLIDFLKRAKVTDERKKELSELLSNMLSFDRDMIKKNLDDTGKEMDNILSESIKKWDLYKKVNDATGNSKLASQLAFGGALKNPDVLSDIRSQFSKNPKANGIKFDSFLNMSDSDLSKYGLNDLKSIRDKYIEEDSKIKQDTADTMTDLIVKNKDASQQILAIKTKLNQDLDKIEKGRSDYEKGGVNVDSLKAARIKEAGDEISKVTFEQFKKVNEWDAIFGDLDKVPNKTLTNLVSKMKDLKYSGAATTEEIKSLEEALKKINDTNLERNPFQGFITSLKEAAKWANILQQMGNGNSVTLQNFSWDPKNHNMRSTPVTYTRSQAESGLYSAQDDEIKAIQGVISNLQSLNNIIEQVSGMFEKLGVGGLSSLTDVLNGGLTGATGLANSAKSIGSLFGDQNGALFGISSKQLGIYGAAAGAAIGIIGGIAEAHDKKLDKAIEKSKLKAQELNNVYQQIETSLKYSLGNAANNFSYSNPDIQKYKNALDTISKYNKRGIGESDLAQYNEYNKASSYISGLGTGAIGFSELGKYQSAYQTINSYKKQSNKLSAEDAVELQKAYDITNNTSDAIKNYIQSGNAYNYQRDLEKEQLAELKKQREDEAKKKNTDKSKILDYDNQISEMESKISTFSEDLANSIYGIDLKGWASQFGDALFQAWQKGESGADAFRKTANNIMAGLVNKFVEVNVIQKAFSGLQTTLFGADGQSGIMGKDNNLTPDAVAVIDQFFSTTMPKTVDDANTLYDKMSELSKKYGVDIKDTTSSASTASSIQGVSEQEANIIASYMDAIRQDTYNIRLQIKKNAEENTNDVNNIPQQQLVQLKAISQNTYRNAELLNTFLNKFNDVIVGNQKIHIV